MDKYQPINVLSAIGVHKFVILTTVTVYLQLLLIRITFNQFIHVYFINLPKICIHNVMHLLLVYLNHNFQWSDLNI